MKNIYYLLKNLFIKKLILYLLLILWFLYQDLLLLIEDIYYRNIEPEVIYIIGIARSGTTGIQTTILNSTLNTYGLTVFDIIYPSNLFKSYMKNVVYFLYKISISKYNTNTKQLFINTYTEDHFLIRKLVYIMVVPELLLFMDNIEKNNLFIYEYSDIMYIKKVIQRKYIKNNIYIGKSIRISNNLNLFTTIFKNIKFILCKRNLIDCLNSYHYIFYSMYNTPINLKLYDLHLDLYIKNNIELYMNFNNIKYTYLINFNDWVINYINILISIKELNIDHVILYKDTVKYINIDNKFNNIYKMLLKKYM